MASLFDTLAKGSNVTVETVLTPPLTFNAQEELNAPQGLLTRLLKPSVTVEVDGNVLYHVAPAGEPAEGVVRFAAIVVGLLVLFILLVKLT